MAGSYFKGAICCRPVRLSQMSGTVTGLRLLCLALLLMPICSGQEHFVATSRRIIDDDALLPKVNAGSVDSAAFRRLSLHAVAPPSAASRSTFSEPILLSDDTSLSREQSHSPDTILKQMSDSDAVIIAVHENKSVGLSIRAGHFRSGS